MELKAFNDSFNPARAKLAAIDGLVKEAGQHFNESQLEKAHDLLDELADIVDDALSAAGKALDVEEKPGETADATVDASNVGFEVQTIEEVPEGYEPKDGDMLVHRDGKTFRVAIVSSDALAPAPIKGQGNQLDPHEEPITAQAIASLKVASDAAERKGLELHNHATHYPGIITKQTGDVIDKPIGDRIELATTEGDIQGHHTDDASKTVQDKDEKDKLLTPQTLGDGGTNNQESAALAELKGDSDGTHQFTPSITADQPADEAAVESGKQEVVPVPPSPSGTSGVVVDEWKEQPADAGNVREHPQTY